MMEQSAIVLPTVVCWSRLLCLTDLAKQIVFLFLQLVVARLQRLSSIFLLIFAILWSRRIPGVTVMLSEAKHLWSNLRNRMGTDAAIRTTVVLMALSLAPLGCRKHVAVVQVDPNGPVEVVIPERGVY